MRVPAAEYSLKGFLDYLRTNHDSVFGDEERKKWLKMYTVLHSLEDWKGTLFERDELRDLGEIAEITIAREGQQEFYYAAEYSKGLLIFFTSAVLEGYEETLGDRIRKTRGVTEA